MRSKSTGMMKTKDDCFRSRLSFVKPVRQTLKQKQAAKPAGGARGGKARLESDDMPRAEARRAEP